MSARFQKQIVELEAASAKNDGLNLQIAINYGSRDEMIRAMKKMCQDMENGTRQVSELNEDLFASYLDTAGIPDPDLLIRTSGSSVFRTICYGSLRTVNFILPMCHGRILEKRN